MSHLPPRVGVVRMVIGAVLLLALTFGPAVAQDTGSAAWTDWRALPDLPNPIGVAGPISGVHLDRLIVAGGANFPSPVWSSEKQWHDQIHVLDLSDPRAGWTDGGRLPHPIAYSACVTTDFGVLAIGGNDAQHVLTQTWLLTFDRSTERVEWVRYPDLPVPLVHATAAVIGDVVYVTGGQTGTDLATACDRLFTLDLSRSPSDRSLRWREKDALPGGPRSVPLSAAQHDGFETCFYVGSGRRRAEGAKGGKTGIEFLRDLWSYRPSDGRWRRHRDVPTCVMAGLGVAVAQCHLLAIGGDDGQHFSAADDLRDRHPGFPRRCYAYHTITDTWVDAGTIPANQVTTHAVPYAGGFLVPSGEVRPRVRTPNVWWVRPRHVTPTFGSLNTAVLVIYLVLVLGVGIYFARGNRSTEDYFRGGQRIPWWAAGCSIFATILSSLTFLGIPAKAFAQDWVYAVGNFMVPLVAFVAVYFAMPIFRGLDLTSIYGYLERRFNRPVRWFGSLSFAIFHLFRMAVVMSLTGLAIAVATPLTPQQAVIVMGLLSIVYCTAGGIEAVIWTDTVQTVVLLGGAVLALMVMLAGVEGGAAEVWRIAIEDGKLNLINGVFDPASVRLAFWVVIFGAIGQNVATYTADQAVAQRYVTTSSDRHSARSIWIGVWMVIPATLLFFSLGSGLYAFYKSNPERLAVDVAIDQVFPMFIVGELPIGLAGLVVAGIFAAAQSTVSTSMNSTATAVLIDWTDARSNDRPTGTHLFAARVLTFGFGAIGTGLALLFVDPSIKSLFDTFIAVIGLCMGVLGGLFVLGMLSQRVDGRGAMAGIVGGIVTMFVLWQTAAVQPYLLTTCGITATAVVGYVVGCLFPPPRELEGLTIWTRKASSPSAESAEFTSTASKTNAHESFPTP